MGELGTQPMGCKISDVKLKDDSAFVCGKAFDKYSDETFNIDIWVGSFIQKMHENGNKDFVPVKRKFLITTDTDGIFCVKFKIQKNDILGMDQIGYDPAIFEIFNYLQDANILE